MLIKKFEFEQVLDIVSALNRGSIIIEEQLKRKDCGNETRELLNEWHLSIEKAIKTVVNARVIYVHEAIEIEAEIVNAE